VAKSGNLEQAPFSAIAKQALTAYGLDGCSLGFIRHSDSVTFKVEDTDSRAYVLRIHVPVTDAMGAHGADSAAVRSELLWLEALSRDTDLVLQVPVRNRAGALVTHIPLEDKTETVNCTLLHWVDGEPYQRELESEETARQIGRIMATLHTHSSQWVAPHGFTRPARDIAYFDQALSRIRPAAQDGRISPSDHAELETSIGLLTDLMRSLDESPQRYGLMHADAHKGNVLYLDGRIRLIDFSFCAFGNFMFDMAICLSDMQEGLHRSFLGSYQSLRALPDDYPRLIEGLFVGSMVGTFSYWVANPRAQQILVTKAPQIARQYAAEFNRGEYFWFS
jgi:Ser/Thr protein kinase RdoA (MazF antagonist)